jgi:hypothetical protein
MLFRLSRWFVLCLPWFIACLCVGAWLVARVPPTGIFQRTFVFDGTSPWFNTFLPGQRVTSPGRQPEGWVGQRIFEEPVYASARIPGAYDEVEVQLDLRPTRQPLLELGLANREGDQFVMVPIWSEVLQRGWRQVTRASTTGYVRSDLPDQTLIDAPANAQLVWQGEGPTRNLMDRRAEQRTYDISLRGGHDFHFIPVNGVIDLKLSIQDVNRNRGANSVAFRLTQGDEVLWTDAIGVSGIRDTRPTKVYDKSIRITDLRPGIYRLSVIADDDIFIRRISTTAEHWVLGPRLYFGDVNGFATSTPSGRAWTNSQHVKIDTVHKEGLQQVRFGSARVDLRETHTSYPLSRDPRERTGEQLLEAARADVRILGDGFFAFDRDRLFYPVPRRLTDVSDPIAEGIQVIYTPYLQPQERETGWKEVRGRYRIAAEAGQSIRLVLSAPGIATRTGSVDIRSGAIRYLRPPLSWDAWLEIVRRELRAAWHRI